jgi:hypothetical protein
MFSSALLVAAIKSGMSWRGGNGGEAIARVNVDESLLHCTA